MVIKQSKRDDLSDQSLSGITMSTMPVAPPLMAIVDASHHDNDLSQHDDNRPGMQPSFRIWHSPPVVVQDNGTQTERETHTGTRHRIGANRPMTPLEVLVSVTETLERTAVETTTSESFLQAMHQQHFSMLDDEICADEDDDSDDNDDGTKHMDPAMSGLIDTSASSFTDDDDGDDDKDHDKSAFAYGYGLSADRPPPPPPPSYFMRRPPLAMKIVPPTPEHGQHRKNRLQCCNPLVTRGSAQVSSSSIHKRAASDPGTLFPLSQPSPSPSPTHQHQQQPQQERSRHSPLLQESRQAAMVVKTAKKGSLLDQMTESLVDALCILPDKRRIAVSRSPSTLTESFVPLFATTTTEDSPICDSNGSLNPEKLNSEPVSNASASSSPPALWDTYQGMLQSDIFQLMECSSPPNAEEIHHVWDASLLFSMCQQDHDGHRSQYHDPQKHLPHCPLYDDKDKDGAPKRRSLAERALRVHQLRYAQAALQQSAMTGLAASSSCSLGVVMRATGVSSDHNYHRHLDAVPDASHPKRRNGSPVTWLRRSIRSMDDRLLTVGERRSGRTKAIINAKSECRCHVGCNVERGGTTSSWLGTARHQKKSQHVSKLYRTSSDAHTSSSGKRSSCVPSNAIADLDGYDSDPGEVFPSLIAGRRKDIMFSNHVTERTDDADRNALLLSLPPPPPPPLPPPSVATSKVDMNTVRRTVLETMNLTWNLTWHSRNNMKNALGSSTPTPVHVWIERGALIRNNRHMVEPCLMWRESFQPMRSGRNVIKERQSRTLQLNASTKNPYRIRLLDLCRIHELTSSSIWNDVAQRHVMSTSPSLSSSTTISLMPLLFPSRCLVVRTSTGEVHIFESSSIQARDEIIQRWKWCVARFAMLAVMEDIDTVQHDFFVPDLSSTTNLVNNNNNNNTVHSP